LGENDVEQLFLAETISMNVHVPCGSDGPALNDPQNSEDYVRHNQYHNRGLKRSDELFRNRYPKQEEAYGDFGPHEGSKCLNPFSVAVILEFTVVGIANIISMSSVTEVKLRKIKSGSNYGA